MWRITGIIALLVLTPEAEALLLERIGKHSDQMVPESISSKAQEILPLMLLTTRCMWRIEM
ncbi:hypothetical protein A3J11_00160 [Candidatus Kaiserbacteria bacterium RIFCSPLOWO2_02_FULL_55_12]|uniref:Uncharacterized protein n=1 Tax=Candidatus Kaiserbacteria bacterium RIFCSPLOWO2_02_FULL_55_12 TaxID=1798522 RepID=A0A1F6F0L0_9BACT|nr:MAG: hypothetical protein A3J11_00160 [Candidatus Kaiserbacteria bacterium RIFCSPLOWO2_02_FULL_55_12]